MEARFANMSPCLIGMEACVGAHHLSRKLKALGHDARLMPARYVVRERLVSQRTGTASRCQVTTSWWGASIWTRPIARTCPSVVFSNVGRIANHSKVSRVRFLPAESQGESWWPRGSAMAPLPPVTGGQAGPGTPLARILLSTRQLPRTQKAYRYYDATTMPVPGQFFHSALEVGPHDLKSSARLRARLVHPFHRI